MVSKYPQDGHTTLAQNEIVRNEGEMVIQQQLEIHLNFQL